jgi:hypothetical protein
MGIDVPAIHHLGYVVDGELSAAATRFAARLGAGPFFAMEHIAFDEVTYLGQPAVYDHSSCFGRWGPLILELTRVHEVAPGGLAARLVAPGAGVGHVAWLADSLADESARLEAAGLEPFHAGRTGPASAVWFDGSGLLGHPVEVLERREELLRFYAMVSAAAEGWQGEEPYRLMTAPPA